MIIEKFLLLPKVTAKYLRKLDLLLSLKKFSFSSTIEKYYEIAGEKYISIGKNTVIRKNCRLGALTTSTISPEILIGNDTYIGFNLHLLAIRSVKIGNEVLIADRVFISDNRHSYEDISQAIKNQDLKFLGSVSIGDRTWIGENVCITGVSIGRHCVVAANSVVNRDIPDYCIAAGAPAKIIKRYDPDTAKWKRTDENGNII